MKQSNMHACTLLILVLLFLFFSLPPITEVPVAQKETNLVIRKVFIQTSTAYLWFSPATHIVTVILLVGLFIGIFNVVSYFLMPGYTLWNLILHIPLITIGAYGLLIANRENKDTMKSDCAFPLFSNSCANSFSR